MVVCRRSENCKNWSFCCVVSTMANYRVALLVKNPSDGEEFVVARQVRPPPNPLKGENGSEHRYVDSDLWDIPSATLSPRRSATELDSTLRKIVENVENALEMLKIREFDVCSAVQEILMQIFRDKQVTQPWKYWKFVEEPDFGPGLPLHTVFFIMEVKPYEHILSEGSKWLTFSGAWRLFVEVNSREDRVGPLAVAATSSHFGEPLKLKFNIKLRCQEYPPGVLIVPMDSATSKPFRTTNLIIFAPESSSTIDCYDSKFATYGDALIMDPGCHFGKRDQLTEIVTSLPKKLVIFVTHHHRDHVDGLSTIQRCNPNATLLGHEATIRRIGKGTSGIKCLVVHGGSMLCIGGEEFQVISAPGHTDGHMALLHVMTHTLIVGDHCVGQGSSLLDPRSGGNMKDYIETTYQFLEISPRTLIPMHGRLSLWPANLLSGYVKHREERETKVLKAIESGARTLYEIVSKVYIDVDHSMWIAAAANVKLHVEHLACQAKLPVDFSLEMFHASCGMRFLLKVGWARTQNIVKTNSHLTFVGKLFPVLCISVASYLLLRSKIQGKMPTSYSISY